MENPWQQSLSDMSWGSMTNYKQLDNVRHAAHHTASSTTRNIKKNTELCHHLWPNHLTLRVTHTAVVKCLWCRSMLWVSKCQHLLKGSCKPCITVHPLLHLFFRSVRCYQRPCQHCAHHIAIQHVGSRGARRSSPHLFLWHRWRGFL